MGDSYYSISMTVGGNVIFNGEFGVDSGSNLIDVFYELIGGINLLNDRFVDNGFNGADNEFTLNNFSFGGTNINYMDYYSNIASPTYQPTWAFFNFSTGLDGNNYITPLLENGDPAGEPILSTFEISFRGSSPSCFNQGTKILCLNKNLEEEYVVIENLRKGDLVKSYKHGYRKIDLIGKNLMTNNGTVDAFCMFKMEKTEENGLIEDLIVTGGHAILVDDLGEYKEKNDTVLGATQMIDDKYLLLCSVSNHFTKLENTEPYIYYHFILENNGNNDERFGVWANGMLTETPSKNQFTNHNYTLV
jgi:hypothetical protein